MNKIVAYRKSLCHNLAREWEWSCPVWFGHGIFADAVIRGRHPFRRKSDAIRDLNKTMKLFGVTKKELTT
jgi:hypothetical protein